MRSNSTDAVINLATEYPEFDAWEWVSPERLPELVVLFMRSLYFDVLADFHTLWSGNFE